VKSCKSDLGSIAPLGIGFALISLATVLTLAAATSLFVFQRRLATLAESSAIAVASGSADIHDFLLFSQQDFQNLQPVTLVEPDQKTTTVILCATWSPFVSTFAFVAQQQVCGKASARSG
jgi:hypothetical protein